MVQKIELRIAELGITIYARDSQIILTVPNSHKPFVVTRNSNSSLREPTEDLLTLQVLDQQNIPFEKASTPIVLSKVWELWAQESGGNVFISPRQVSPKQVCIGEDYHRGEIYGDFTNNQAQGFYPLSSIDIRIMVNWLATKGDLILHASGMIFDDQGYCFIGDSGAGKSTIIRALAGEKGVKVMGEDQVILRYLDGEFWIFGTPWHEDPEYVSPDGVRLRKIFFLNRESDEVIRRIKPDAGVTRILQTAFVPYYLPEKMGKIMDRLGILAQNVPFFEIHYQLGSSILPQILSI